MKILVISPSPPLSLGPAIHLEYVTRALVRDHEVDVICGDFDTILGSMLSSSEVRKKIESEPYHREIRNLWVVPFSRRTAWLRLGLGWLRGTPMRMAFCNSPEFAREFRSRLREREYDLVWTHFGRMEPFVRKLNMPVIVDLHDSMSLRHETLGRAEKNPAKRFIHRLESRREARHECELIARGYHLIVNSTADAKHLEHAGAEPSRVTVLPNVVEWQELENSPVDPSLKSTILFFGQMGYFPNQDAVRFFHDQILPKIFAENPSATFCVVGAHPPKWMRDFERDPRIRVTGFVPNLGAYIKQASVVIAPLRCGSGVCLKVVQALALGRPVVATSHGARGLDVEHDKQLLIADEPQDFARQVNALLRDAAMRTRLGNAGRSLARSRYSLEAIFQGVQDLVTRVVPANRSSVPVHS
jgi:glycosyltransferase involved in cell wall biosynthesis